ncbi:MAG TPA: aldehyde dehydrogenase [Streptosporangiaceae bacterium]|jgi:5-carboxymethyl-2-hydroxymuconic-semialdehyde dehydrogenase|nr:aldehyde dehydrogenase [Streptosporangiaceae bacterium]
MSTASVAGVDVDTRHWIGGRRVPSRTTFTDLSPIDEQPLAEMARGGEAEVTAAVRAAGQAFAGWSATPPQDRAAVLHAIADRITDRAADLAQVETLDNGALLRSHLRSVMPRAAQNFRFFADWLGRLDGGDLDIAGHREQVSWAPSGVTAVITPWNAPLMLATWRIAPALAAGNTVVAKPPEWAPLTASLLADITAEAGLPSGVFNVVQGLGAEAGAPLAAHPDLARVCFTGSVATGRQVAAAAGRQLTPASLELGGKSPLLVFEDADLDLAVRHAVGQYDNAGQVCLAGTRLLVAEPVAEEFLARFTARAAALRQGDPRQDGTDVGPNITREHVARVDGFVRRAVAAGARPLLGGAVNPDLGGLYYQPTLLAGAAPGSEILTEEVFGPVLTVQTFAGEQEAVALANSTRYGLAAMVFTGDRSRAGRIAAQLVAGTVWVNCFFVRDLRAPFGGARQSGIGREGGTWSFDFYGDVKNTVYAPEGWHTDG